MPILLWFCAYTLLEIRETWDIWDPACLSFASFLIRKVPIRRLPQHFVRQTVSLASSSSLSTIYIVKIFAATQLASRKYPEIDKQHKETTKSSTILQCITPQPYKRRKDRRGESFLASARSWKVYVGRVLSLLLHPYEEWERRNNLLFSSSSSHRCQLQLRIGLSECYQRGIQTVSGGCEEASFSGYISLDLFPESVDLGNSETGIRGIHIS